MLRSIEASRSEAKDQAAQASFNHRIRNELLKMTDERNKALTTNKEIKQSLALCRNELKEAHTKMKKLEREKGILQRDQRQLLSLATTNSTSPSPSARHSSDLDFHKRKVSPNELYCYTSLATILQSSPYTVTKTQTSHKRSPSSVF